MHANSPALRQAGWYNKSMKSPFPGMDPYLEPYWHDIHVALVGSARNALNENLPPHYVARSEERIAVDTDNPDHSHSFRPDVVISRPDPEFYEPQPGESVETQTIDAPIKFTVMFEPIIEHYIKIISSDDETVVTIIEFLSPTNKIGRGATEYLQKRDEFLSAGVNVVEIDLVRRGDWRALIRPASLGIDTPYRVITRLAGDHRSAHGYPIRFDHRLPKIQIPLRAGDPKVILELQPLLDAAYRGGRYGQTLNYAKPLDPPPTAAEASVIEQLLKGTAARK